MKGSSGLVTEQPGRTEVHIVGYRVTVGRDRRSSRLLLTETRNEVYDSLPLNVTQNTCLQ